MLCCILHLTASPDSGIFVTQTIYKPMFLHYRLKSRRSQAVVPKIPGPKLTGPDDEGIQELIRQSLHAYDDDDDEDSLDWDGHEAPLAPRQIPNKDKSLNIKGRMSEGFLCIFHPRPCISWRGSCVLCMILSTFLGGRTSQTSFCYCQLQPI